MRSNEPTQMHARTVCYGSVLLSHIQTAFNLILHVRFSNGFVFFHSLNGLKIAESIEDPKTWFPFQMPDLKKLSHEWCNSLRCFVHDRLMAISAPISL